MTGEPVERLSAEELAVLEPFYGPRGEMVRSLIAEIRAAWAERDAAQTSDADFIADEACRLLDEFDRFASSPPDNTYVGSPFQSEVRDFLGRVPDEDDLKNSGNKVDR